MSLSSNINSFSEYTEFVKSKMRYPEKHALVYTTLGLVGEMAEILDVVFNKVLTSDETLELTDCQLFKEVELHRQLTYCVEQMMTAGNALQRISKGLRGDPDKQIPGLEELFEFYRSKGLLKLDDEQTQKYLKELGDPLYFITAGAEAVGSNVREVAAINESKLTGRELRGTLKGDGDDR